MIRPLANALGLAALGLVLGGATCSPATTAGGFRPTLQTLDARLTADCDDAVTIPARRLPPSEVKRLWGRDRIALADCGRRHGAVVEIIAKRDAGISGP